MELCSLCQRIKEIRIYQARLYYHDLCDECRRKEIIKIYLNMRKRIENNNSKQKKPPYNKEVL